MNFASIRFKLIASFSAIGLALLVFMVVFVPSRTRATAESVLQESTEFVVSLLADNLAIGMQARELDEGATLQQTLALLKGDVISSVAVLDLKYNLVKSINTDTVHFLRDTIVDQGPILRVFRTMLDSDGKEQGYVEIGFSKRSFMQRINRFGVSIWVAGITALVAVMVVGTFLSNRIVSPLNRSVVMLQALATGKGDLTKRLKLNSSDEVGRQAEWINRFVENLHAMVKEIQANALELRGVSEGLSTLSEDTSGLALNMKSKAENSALFTRSIRASLDSVRDAASTMATEICSIASAMEEMNHSIGQVAQSCQREFELTQDANARATNARQHISALETMAKKIGTVVGLIQNIADKTNLLALNATIQAASAGSAGRGFTVVANEIKELAKQTGQATKEINLQIEGVRQTIHSSVEEINSIASIINDVNTVSRTIVIAVDEQSTTTSEVTRHVNGTSVRAQEMQGICDKSAGAVAQITENINDVDGSARKTQDSVQKNREHILSMTQAVEKLYHLVNQFRI